MYKLSEIIPFADKDEPKIRITPDTIYLYPSIIEAPYWEIKTNCPVCEGSKVTEEVHSGVDAAGPWKVVDTVSCTTCDAEGYSKTYCEPGYFYDSRDAVLRDYPDAHVTLIAKEK